MDYKVKKIVLTGGPCAGKSTAMSWIQNSFTERGYKVLIVPETATELIGAGVAPWVCTSNIDYQRCQMRLQMEKEEIFMQAARSMKYKKILIVCDRGLMDNKAYMSDEDFSQIASENNSSEVEFRDSYDAVFHIVTAAKGAEEFYITSNNQARTESAEEAAKLDDKLIAAWTGHPHFRVIDNSTGFEEKMKRLISGIAAFLGEPRPYEIERKFLIEYPDVKMLESLPNCQRVELIQTYLKSVGGDEVRLRQRGEHGSYIYYKTVKRNVSSVKRFETESRLNQREYAELLMEADTSCHQIRKTRYCLTYHSQYFEIDIYPFWNDKAIVEIELTDEKQKIEFPSFLHMIREVTDDVSYRNAALARKTEHELGEYEHIAKRNVFAIGRWMPLHMGHKAFLTKLAKEYDMLIIGVGSCYENGTIKNSIPAVLREKLLRCMLWEEGISHDKIKIVLVQDYDTFEEWIESVLEVCRRNRVTHFCTGNKEDILSELESKGIKLPFEFINPEDDSDFNFHATDVRNAIINGDKELLEKMVPAEVLPMVKDCVAKEVLAASKGEATQFIPGRQTVDIIFIVDNCADCKRYVLLGEREPDKTDFPGATAVPGGGILLYESPVDAAVRVFELETGIDLCVVDNTKEPAIISIRQLSAHEEKLHFVGIYASADERINGTKGGASQCFCSLVNADIKTIEKYLFSRHDMENLRFVLIEDALEMKLAYEQSKMLRDAVKCLDGGGFNGN